MFTSGPWPLRGDIYTQADLQSQPPAQGQPDAKLALVTAARHLHRQGAQHAISSQSHVTSAIPRCQLAAQVYSQPGKVHSMLEALQQEATATMLFLRSLERIEILEWHPGHAEPQVLFECQIATSPQLRSARQLFSRASSPGAAGQDIAGA